MPCTPLNTQVAVYLLCSMCPQVKDICRHQSTMHFMALRKLRRTIVDDRALKPVPAFAKSQLLEAEQLGPPACIPCWVIDSTPSAQRHGVIMIIDSAT